MKCSRLPVFVGKFSILALSSLCLLSLVAGCNDPSSGDGTPIPVASPTPAPVPSPTPSIGQAPTPITSGIFMAHNDLYRTGRNLTENKLNRTNVNSSKFGLIGRLPVDGQVYAQPLVANGVVSGNPAIARNLVIVVTENDSVFAYDASSTAALSNPTPIWKTSFLETCPPTSTGSSGTCTTVNVVTDIQSNAPNIAPVIGITATPAIDPNTHTVYVTAMTSENGVYFWKLHALSLETGAEKLAPVVITSSYPGNGTGSTNGTIPFNPIKQLSRAGLVLNNGMLTVAFTSFDDNEADHGWVFTYNAATLQLAGTWMTTPNTGDGTIWQGGGAPGVDDDGSLVFATGNGDSAFANQNPPDLSDSVIKIKMSSPNYVTPNSAYTTNPFSFFTPYNHAALATNDVDVGSGGVLLIPTADNTLVGSSVPLVVAGGKQGTLYLLNRNNLGGLANQTDQGYVVDELLGGVVTVGGNQGFLPGGKNYGAGIYGTPAYYNGKVFIGTAADFLRSIPIVGGLFYWPGMQQSPVAIANRGATPSISATGPATSDAIVWYLDASAYSYQWVVGAQPTTKTNGSSILYAFSTDDLSAYLYKSDVTNLIATPTTPLAPSPNGDVCNTTANAAGCAVKFAVPTVQNGMVFVGTDTEISVFGLLNQP